jgi:hypothetical protein
VPPEGDLVFAAYVTVTIVTSIFTGIAATTYLIGHPYPKSQLDMKRLPRSWGPRLGVVLPRPRRMGHSLRDCGGRFGTEPVVARSINERSATGAGNDEVFYPLIFDGPMAFPRNCHGLLLWARRIAGIGVGVAAYQALYFVGVAWGGVAVATAVALGVAPVAIVIYSCSVPSCSPAGGDESTRVPAAVAGVEIVDGVARFSVGRCSRRTGNAVFIVPWSCSYRLPLG